MKRKLLLSMMLMFLLVSSAWAQRTITGTVTSEEGSLPGATIQIKGTTQGTQTDMEGKYTLTVPEGSDVLVFSFVGFTAKEETIGNRTVIDVVLTEGDALSEVVVTAYGTQKREALTGSISEVSAKQVSDLPSGNVLQGLNGKVAGVQIIQQSGQPGSSPTIRFRGIGSINASSDPLYVVDGVPFYGDINTINNQDIESIVFLKDASAAALYGSRGANGVIILTTKKGKNNKVRVTFDTRIGISTRGIADYNVITDPAKYYEARFQAIRNDLILAGESAADASSQASEFLITDTDGVLGYPLGYNVYDVADNQVIDPTTGKLNSSANLLYQEDWSDELFQTNSTYLQSYVSLAGGSDATDYYVSLGYDDNIGYIINSGFERYTGKMRVNTKVNKYIDLGANINYSYTSQRNVDGDGTTAFSNPISFARNIAPIYPVYAYVDGQQVNDANGNPLYDDGTGRVTGVARPYASLQNPVATAQLDVNRNNNNNVFGTTYAKVNFTDYLNFTYNVAVDLRDRAITEFDTPQYGDAAGDVNGRLNEYAIRNLNVTQQQILNFDKSFDLHNITALLGHEYNSLNFRYLQTHKTNFLLPEEPIMDFGANIQGVNGFEQDYNVEGYFARVMYDYNERYYFNASFRRDGSSVFAPENRWGNFYGLGAAWRLSQEEFLAGVTWLNELKLKTSYGEQGNDNLLYPSDTRKSGYYANRNFYPYRDQFQVVPSDGALSVQLAFLGNKNISWEVNRNFNVGFDLAAFKNRLNVNVEYFTRTVSDMLFDTPLPLSTGNPSFPENVGDMVNRGIELSMSGDVLKTKDFSLGISVNATHFQNEITRLPQEFIDDSQFRLEEGRSRYEYFLRAYAGYNPENGNTMWYKDVLGDDGEPTGERETTELYAEATEYFTGEDAIPDVYGGFAFDFRYKSFDLGLNFAYQIGGKGYDGVYWGLYDMTSLAGSNIVDEAYGNTWTPENTTAEYPRLSASSAPNNYDPSDVYLVDASYLSLQNVSLGYTFDKSITSKLKVASLRVFALANNVGILSARQGYDPRLSLTGTSSNEFSIMRTMTFGLNVQF
ncbi:TonB-dependent receptor [Bernardetia sp. Wsw4-3y2]|uniref:SusC/RagA family TonB-linked outer membrane protein n=1 Tax=Bernardetia sp. Wsw4-3y2 TaxID=3127471 RepID=UPI0030D213A7